MKRILGAAAAIVICTTAFIPAQASASVGLNIVIGNAPPPLRYEVVPAPRRGYEWAPGFWNWNGRRHAWVVGHWERVHVGQRYEHAEWRQDNDGWHLNRGGWKHDENRDERHDEGHGNPHGDRDHDGVPNRADHDRDGDGVPNRVDAHPNDPHRD